MVGATSTNAVNDATTPNIKSKSKYKNRDDQDNIIGGVSSSSSSSSLKRLPVANSLENYFQKSKRSTTLGEISKLKPQFKTGNSISPISDEEKVPIAAL